MQRGIGIVNRIGIKGGERNNKTTPSSLESYGGVDGTDDNETSSNVMGLVGVGSSREGWG